MSYKQYIIPEPLDGDWELRLDSGLEIQAMRDVRPDGVQCQSLLIPDGTPNKNGASLVGIRPGYLDEYYHGFLYLDEPVPGQAALLIDIFKMKAIPEAPPPEPPTNGETDPNLNPLNVINYVYNSTHPNLSTHAGCGKFTEDCCTELHNTMHPGWGHIKKDPGQNQFNGHAVDAIMLLVPSGGTAPGIYDIIRDSVSPNASPVFNYVEPPNNSKWYYPAAPITSATMAAAEELDKKKKSKK